MLHIRHEQRERPWQRVQVWALCLGIVVSAWSLQASEKLTLPWYQAPIVAAGNHLTAQALALRERLGDWWLDARDRERLQLAQALHMARMALAQAEELRRERDGLQAIMQQHSTADAPPTLAHVVQHDLRGAFETMIIDRGADDHVTVGMPVIAQEGLVGHVAQVGARFAKVLIMTDPNHAVDVVSQRSRARAILQGRGRSVRLGRLGAISRLEYMDPGADFQEGDLLVTSGLDGRFPPGIPVGTVQRIVREGSGLLHFANVMPSIPWTHIRDVGLLPARPSVTLEADRAVQP